MMRRDVSLGALALSAVAVYSILLWRKAIVFGAVWEWYFPYIGGLNWSDLLVSLLAAACVFWLIRRALALFPHKRGAAFGMLLVGGMAFLLLGNSRRLFSAEEIMINIKAESFYDAASRISVRDLFAHSDMLAEMFPQHQHLHTNFPGKLLYYKALALVSGGAFFAVMMNMLLSCAGAVLVFLAGKLLFENERVGLVASVFYLFAPQRLYFFPLLNLITPLFLLAVLLAAIMAARSKSLWWAALYGAFVVCTAMFDPVPLVFLALATLGVWCCAIVSHRAELRDVIRFALVGALAIVACLILARLLYGYNYLHNLAASSAGNRHYSPFPYSTFWPLFFTNLRTYLTDLGLPILVALGWGLARFRKKTLPLAPAALFAAAFISMLIFDAIAFAGAEATRVWLFLLVPFCLCAGAFVEECDDSLVALLGGALVFQALPTVAHIGFILI